MVAMSAFIEASITAAFGSLVIEDAKVGTMVSWAFAVAQQAEVTEKNNRNCFLVDFIILVGCSNTSIAP